MAVDLRSPECANGNHEACTAEPREGCWCGCHFNDPKWTI